MYIIIHTNTTTYFNAVSNKAAKYIQQSVSRCMYTCTCVGLFNFRKEKLNHERKEGEHESKREGRRELYIGHTTRQWSSLWKCTLYKFTHYHNEGCSVNFEHFFTDVKLTTSTKAVPSVSVLSAASPPAAHEQTSLELHTAKCTTRGGW